MDIDARTIVFLVLIASSAVGAGCFLVGWYHGWKMLMNRNGHWAGYALPFAFLFDAALTQEGIRHRTKALIFMPLGLVFCIIFALGTELLK